MSENIKIVIIGNGFGGIYALKNLHKNFKNHKNVKFILVGERNYFLFTPLLHEVATGGLNRENIIEPIRKIFSHCLSEFHLGYADEINLTEKKIKVGKEIISYDYLVLAPGAETNFFNIQGAEKYSLTLKTIEDAVKIKNHCINQMERASHIRDEVVRKKMLNFVIVGGGPTGVELAAEIKELLDESFTRYYPREIIRDVTVTLIQKGPELLPQFNPKLRAKSLKILADSKVQILLNTNVIEVSPDSIKLGNDVTIETETVIWVAGIKPKELKFNVPVNKSPDGKLLVNQFLQLENNPEVFILGDAAYLKKEGDLCPYPALAQVATKEAEMVAKNIKLLTLNKELESFTYSSRGTLISLGRWMAAGEILGFTISGHLTWWLWRTVYLSKMISTGKKFRIATDWTMNIFSPRDISQI